MAHIPGCVGRGAGYFTDWKIERVIGGNSGPGKQPLEFVERLRFSVIEELVRTNRVCRFARIGMQIGSFAHLYRAS